MDNSLLKWSILSISLLTIMASAAISPALAKISQAFPGVDRTLIKMILTLPSLFIIPCSLLSGWLASRMKKKTLLLIGLFIYLAGGVGGGLSRTIPELLFCRAILGVGVGLIMPLSTSLIGDLFLGEQRAKMMGYSGAVSHVGGVVFLLLSGWLAVASWRYAFAVYALALVTILMIILWLPGEDNKQGAKVVKAMPVGGVYLFAFFGMLMMIAFYAAPTNLALFIESEGISRPGLSGYFLSAMTLAGAVTGVFFAPMMRLIGPFCSTFGVALMAAGFGMLGRTNSLPVILLSLVLIGLSAGILMPILLLGVSRLSTDTSRAMSMAVLSIGVYLGQFLSPVVLSAVTRIFGRDTFRFQFDTLAAGLGLATAIGIWFSIKTARKGDWKKTFPAANPAH